MKYLILGLAVFAGVLLVLLLVGGLVWLAVDAHVWWAPVAFVVALLIAVLAGAVEWMTDRRTETPPPQP